jgi:adenine-specific DNA-methyltransferase
MKSVKKAKRKQYVERAAEPDVSLALFDHPSIASDFGEAERIVLHCGDSLEFLRTLPSESVKLIISSPPYNIGKSYERRTGIDDYLGTQEPVIAELVRALKRNGSICWQVGNYVDDGEIVPLDIPYYGLFKAYCLKLRNRQALLHA